MKSKNKLIQIVCISTFSCIASIACGQCNKAVPLKIDNKYYSIDSLNTNKKIVNKDHTIILNLTDCKGTLSYLEIDKKNITRVNGQYVNGLDTLKEQVTIETELADTYVEVRKYFEPLKNGIWKYYNSKGKLIKEEEWHNGVIDYRKTQILK